jgi:hypothetical protein
VGRKPRRTMKTERVRRVKVGGVEGASRHVPEEIKRTVYERDGGQCAFVDSRGRRCPERGFLQLDHVNGFARTREHKVETVRLLCAVHNQYTADLLYGRDFMDDKRQRPTAPSSTDSSG